MLDFAVETMPGNFGVVAMDLDGLKAINDEGGGHKAGDKYIRYAAGILHEIIRDGDALPVHLSGDEFVGIFPGVNRKEHLDNVIIGRIQPILDDLGVPTSMGGKIHTLGETPQQIMHAADELELRNKWLRKLESHTPEQRTAALRIAEIAVAASLNLRDVPTLLKAMGADFESDGDSEEL
jgi:diguanylate cyclase (GGDEF)-like protein